MIITFAQDTPESFHKDHDSIDHPASYKSTQKRQKVVVEFPGIRKSEQVQCRFLFRHCTPSPILAILCKRKVFNERPKSFPIISTLLSVHERTKEKKN